MSRSAYRIEYERMEIPQNYEFFDWLQRHLENDDGQVYIYPEGLDDFLSDRPEDAERFKEEIKALRKELKKHETFDMTFF